MKEESFWVIPDVTELRTPIAILNEQATFLAEETKGLLKGEVETTQSGETLIIKFYIVVSALNNYRFQILQYTQPITLYPGNLYWNAPGGTYTIADENQFSSRLKEILSSLEVQSVIKGLLAQARQSAE